MAVTTIDNLRTKLSTHATTAGAVNFLWGWIDEVNPYLQDKTTLTSKYPMLVVQPTNWNVNHAGLPDFEIDLKFQIYSYNDPDVAIERSATYDAMVLIARAFINAINTDDNLQVKFKDIPMTLYDVGQIVEQALMISVEAKLEIIC